MINTIICGIKWKFEGLFQMRNTERA